jgi:hypothetical protein
LAKFFIFKGVFMKSFFRNVIFGFAVVSLLEVSANASAVKVNGISLGIDALDGDISTKDIAKAGVSVATEVIAMPTAVAGASTLGVVSSTGTTISSLSGAAAVSATSAAIGTPVASALTAVTGLALAPAVVGGAIIVVGGGLVAWGINSIFFDEEE